MIKPILTIKDEVASRLQFGTGRIFAKNGAGCSFIVVRSTHE